MTSRFVSPRTISHSVRLLVLGLLLGFAFLANTPVVQAQSGIIINPQPDQPVPTFVAWTIGWAEGGAMAPPPNAVTTTADAGYSGSGQQPGVYVMCDLGESMTISDASFNLSGNPGYPFIAVSNDLVHWTAFNGSHDNGSPYTYFCSDSATNGGPVGSWRYIEYFLGGQIPRIYNLKYNTGA